MFLFGLNRKGKLFFNCEYTLNGIFFLNIIIDNIDLINRGGIEIS